MTRGWNPATRTTMPVQTFVPRFVRPEHLGDLSQLWQTSRTACSKPGGYTKYERMLWTSRQFAIQFDYVTPTAAYKDLGEMLAFGGR